MSAPYACKFIADRRSVSVVEVARTASERTVRVVPGSGPGVEIVLPVWYLPSIAILPGEAVAVWAGTRLFIVIGGKRVIRADFDDEVHAVYAVDGNFCIVGELSVFVYDAERATIVDRYEAEDVLETSWWEGEQLIVESATGTRHVFRPSADAVAYISPP